MVDSRQAQFTERLEKLYGFIVDYKRQNDGIAPSIVEMGEHLGIRSTSLVGYYLRRLVADGRIVMEKKRSRHISVPGGCWSMASDGLRVVGEG